MATGSRRFAPPLHPPMQHPSLVRSAVTAGIWTLAGHGSSQVLRLLGNLLLTRLLAPESFGVMSIATVVSVGVVMFSDLGLRQVIVRSNRASDPVFVNTVWTLQFLQGLAVASLLLLIAGGVAYAQHAGRIPADSTYASKDLPLLIAGLSFGAVLAGLESTRLATAEKDMLLRPVVLIELGSQAAGLLATCAAALVHPSIFVLLLGAIVSGAIKVGASHLLASGIRNRLHFSWPVVREVCRISNWIVLSSALTFLAGNIDKLFLAWLLGSHTMGQFAIAALLVGALTDVVARISSRVAFPALTKAYERDALGLARTYYRVRIPTDAFCLVLAAFLFWFGRDVVRILYDNRYEQAGEFLHILAIALVGSRYSVVPYMYLLLGRPGLMAAEQAFRLTGSVFAIGLGYRLLGTTGAAWGVALGQLSGSLAGLLLFQPRLRLLSVRRELVALALFVGVFGLFGFASH
ncbi:oligosaccharide flippase family protein [Ramlibacter monticola]|uniref:Oligosaccharide flippase family protein n=1 Tax=Ramlibacter monticola TaxID=1926872 RepID=A0A937CTX1_9BURK|nr:oligosaccharide flippase family protein [Ramlibacter monticola]MBL0392014.1 oligosaccharide flippase family protein [Ramlibacter monticola]